MEYCGANVMIKVNEVLWVWEGFELESNWIFFNILLNSDYSSNWAVKCGLANNWQLQYLDNNNYYYGKFDYDYIYLFVPHPHNIYLDGFCVDL